MKRIIYSFYIDIPKDELDLFDKHILKEGQAPINYRTKNAFRENYQKLISCKEWYAREIGVPFKLFEYDTDFMLYKDKLQKDYPYLTTYNVVNEQSEITILGGWYGSILIPAFKEAKRI